MKYKRILLKLSGEMIAGNKSFGIDNDSLYFFAEEIKSIYNKGIQLGVVIGGGNIFRGAELVLAGGIDKESCDYIGMMSTIINGIALQVALEKIGVPCKHITAFKIEKIGEPFNQAVVLNYLAEGKVLIFTGGTSNPYFTTDTAAALRAIEISAEAILKATKVDGVYSADPKKDLKATKYAVLSFDEAISKELKIMDLTAFTLCRENKMPLVVFDAHQKGNILRVIEKGDIGTLVH